MSGFLSVATAAFACSIILSAGTQQPVQSVLSAMMGIHLVIAVFEGIITVCVLRLAESLKSDLCLLGLAVTAGLVSPLASSLPDGLETAAHALGIPSGIKAGIPVVLAHFHEIYGSLFVWVIVSHHGRSCRGFDMLRSWKKNPVDGSWNGLFYF